MANCNRTGKRVFHTKLDADLTLLTIEAKEKRHRHRECREVPTRSYQCEFCHCWHVTSQSKGRKNESRLAHR